jgi:hypothetical protein
MGGCIGVCGGKQDMNVNAALWCSTVKLKFKQMWGILEGDTVSGSQWRQPQRGSAQVNESLESCRRRGGNLALFDPRPNCVRSELVRVHQTFWLGVGGPSWALLYRTDIWAEKRVGGS